ncbi:unnamed protein product [Allacma fusca]|uniref:Copper type II ascorbate-dependent monooxygenase C-terminal domain-containing protein n=1 Tax=Allacma fusca TaxID=39272 RepID=A0A8J2J6G8_9HEXA|nr:unnamed protein product [Allacma fusca]
MHHLVMTTQFMKEHKQIFKGDHLTFECTDDSSDHSPPEAILGGLGTRRKMCLAFVMHYPRMSKLDNCGSFFDEQTLLPKLGIEDTQKIDDSFDVLVTAPPKYANKLYSEVLSKEIPWNDILKLEVQNLTRFGEHIVNCEPRTLTDVKKQTQVTYPVFVPYVPKNECDEDSIITAKN